MERWCRELLFYLLFIDTELVKRTAQRPLCRGLIEKCNSNHLFGCMSWVASSNMLIGFWSQSSSVHRRPLETRLIVDVDLWLWLRQYLNEPHYYAQKMPREAVGPLATLSPTYTHILVNTLMPVFPIHLHFAKDHYKFSGSHTTPEAESHTCVPLSCMAVRVHTI